MGRLCKELYDVLSLNPFDEEYILSFYPNQLDITDNFLIINEPPLKEIVCFKRTLLHVFKEAHDFMLDQQIIINYDGLTSLKLWELYYISIALIVTTAENKRNFNNHKAVFMVLLESSRLDANDIDILIRKEITLVERLLRCPNNRINKSSSLWAWYKRLFVLAEQHHKLDYFDLQIFNKSGLKHFANYYCWNTSRWMFDNLASIESKLKLYAYTKEFCHRNLNDISCWDSLSYMVCQYGKIYSYHVDDYNRMRSDRGDRDIQKFVDIDIGENIKELYLFIDNISNKSWPAFSCLLSMLWTLDDDKIRNIVIEKWGSEVSQYEINELGCTIELYHNFTPVVPNGISDDLLKSDKYVHYGYKKVFLNRLSKSK